MAKIETTENGMTKDTGGHSEALVKPVIETRFANLDNKEDVAAITALFNQISVREHLSGMAPTETPPDIDVKAYARKHPEYNIVIANEEEIREHYKNRIHSHLIVAVDKASSKIVGAITVEAPEGSSPGLLYAGISRIAVSEDLRRAGIARRLVKTAKAYALGKRSEGGLECSVLQAGVIIGIKGKDAPLNLFESEGFETTGKDLHEQCASWSNETNRFAKRDVRIMRLEMPGIKKIDKINVSEIPQKMQA